MLTKIVTTLIVIYQKTISLDHGWLSFLKPYGACKYYPTCSEYCKLAIKKHGLIRGIYLGWSRLKRCHPWSEGGYDPVK